MRKSIDRRKVRYEEDGLTLVVDSDDQGNPTIREDWDPDLTPGQVDYRRRKLRKFIEAEQFGPVAEKRVRPIAGLSVLVLCLQSLLADRLADEAHKDAAKALNELADQVTAAKPKGGKKEGNEKKPDGISPRAAVSVLVQSLGDLLATELADEANKEAADEFNALAEKVTPKN